MASSGARIKVNQKAIRAVLRSAQVRADLQARADRIAAAAGEGMEADSRIGKTRARASVRTGTAAARRAEATDHNLIRALDAGRGDTTLDVGLNVSAGQRRASKRGLTIERPKGGHVWVKPYTKKNGVRVDGYWRDA